MLTDESLREKLVLMLGLLRRRWGLFCIPIVIAIPLAVLAIEFAPTKYSATCLILIQAANRSGGGGEGVQRQNAIEQVSAIEAWLKSDQVLSELLPKLMRGKRPSTPDELSIQMKIMRKALSLELVGGSVVEMKLESLEPHGLGGNLEIIVARLMEALTGPEKGIFNAGQFIHLARSDAVTSADAGLTTAIQAAGLQDVDAVKAQLKLLFDLSQQGLKGQVGKVALSAGVQPGEKGAIDLTRARDELRQKLTVTEKVLTELEQLYAHYEDARESYESLQVRGPSRASNHVGIFDSPENLLVVGRPRDPLLGESSARKLAIAGLLLSFVCGGALVFLAEMFDSRIRTRSEYESLSGVPVVARVGKIIPTKLARA